MKTLFNLLFIAVMLIVGNAYAQDVQVITTLDNGCKIWRNNDGALHRLTGPAIECPKGQGVVLGQILYGTLIHHHMIINLPNNEFIEVAIRLPKELEYTAITTLYAVNGFIVSPEYLKRWYKCYSQSNADAGTYCDPVQMIPNRFSKPSVIGVDGAKYWFWFWCSWRIDAPSFIDNVGNKFWCTGPEPCGTPNGYYRNILTNPGPSVEYANGTKEWWYDGVQYSEEDYNKLRKEIRVSDDMKLRARHGESIE